MSKTNAQKINDFHIAIDGEYAPKPAVPDAETIELRRTLLREEYQEVIAEFDRLSEASSEQERTDAMVALMHELADLLYVTYGAFTAFGVDADAVFGELHRANMQKVSGPRRADGKVMKPADFQPADIGRIIAELQEKAP